jgi:hypothetical protein
MLLDQIGQTVKNPTETGFQRGPGTGIDAAGGQMPELIPLPPEDPKAGMPGTGIHPQDDGAHIKASSS